MRKYVNSEALKKQVMEECKKDGKQVMVALGKWFCALVDEMTVVKDEDPCEFCRRYDFSRVRTVIDLNQRNASIQLTLCNTKFPKEQQFKYCPNCGRLLSEEGAKDNG